MKGFRSVDYQCRFYPADGDSPPHVEHAFSPMPPEDPREVRMWDATAQDRAAEVCAAIHELAQAGYIHIKEIFPPGVATPQGLNLEAVAVSASAVRAARQS